MRVATRGLAALTTVLLLAACSGSAATSAPTTGPAATTGTAATAAAQVCTEPGSTEPADVQATVAGNQWGPVAAKVGDVITWTNSDGVPHKVALDDGSCAMSQNIAGGGTRSLVFSVAGSFPFHCAVHSSMKGTITIS
jgi:plastocyanin